MLNIKVNIYAKNDTKLQQIWLFQKDYNKNILVQNIFLGNSFLVSWSLKKKKGLESLWCYKKEFIAYYYIKKIISMSPMSI